MISRLMTLLVLRYWSMVIPLKIVDVIPPHTSNSQRKKTPNMFIAMVRHIGIHWIIREAFRQIREQGGSVV